MTLTLTRNGNRKSAFSFSLMTHPIPNSKRLLTHVAWSHKCLKCALNIGVIPMRYIGTVGYSLYNSLKYVSMGKCLSKCDIEPDVRIHFIANSFNHMDTRLLTIQHIEINVIIFRKTITWLWVPASILSQRVWLLNADMPSTQWDIFNTSPSITQIIISQCHSNHFCSNWINLLLFSLVLKQQ